MNSKILLNSVVIESWEMRRRLFSMSNCIVDATIMSYQFFGNQMPTIIAMTRGRYHIANYTSILPLITRCTISYK